MNKHVIALLLENEPGALSRVVGLFSARGYNIESLTVAPTEDASLSRMTIVTTGSDSKLDAFLEAIDRAAILETARTGTSGIGRGERILRV
jgi:acetolactate synthase-1/3 small subunit